MDAKMIQEQVLNIVGECNCHRAYTSRGRDDPNCVYHEWYYVIYNAITQAVNEVLEERAAKWEATYGFDKHGVATFIRDSKPAVRGKG